jgi:mRNA interferase MazF
MIYKPFDIIVVPFPFVDSNSSKKRPAIILSSHEKFGKEIEHSIMAMITSARNKSWPLDSNINDLKTTGLSNASVIRMKLFTLDHRLIIEKIGQLSAKDQLNLRKNFKHIFDGIIKPK